MDTGLHLGLQATDIIDIRRFPEEEREAIKRDISHLKAYAYGIKDDPADEEALRQTVPTPTTDKET